MEREIHVLIFFLLLDSPSGPRHPQFWGFEITLSQDTLNSVRLLCMRDQPDAETSLITNNTHKRQTSIPLARFEPTIPANKRPQTHALDREASCISVQDVLDSIFHFRILSRHNVARALKVMAPACYYWMQSERLNFVQPPVAER